MFFWSSFFFSSAKICSKISLKNPIGLAKVFDNYRCFSVFLSLTLNRFSTLCRQKGDKRANLKTVVTRKLVKTRHVFQKNEHFDPMIRTRVRVSPFALLPTILSYGEKSIINTLKQLHLMCFLLTLNMRMSGEVSHNYEMIALLSYLEKI